MAPAAHSYHHHHASSSGSSSSSSALRHSTTTAMIHKKKYPCRHLDCEKSYNDAPNRRKHEIGPYHPTCAAANGHCKRCEKARLSFLCSKCGKSLASNQSVRRHEQICKVVVVKKETPSASMSNSSSSNKQQQIRQTMRKKVPSSPSATVVSSPLASESPFSTEIPLATFTPPIYNSAPAFTSATSTQLLSETLFVSSYEPTEYLLPSIVATTPTTHSDVLSNFLTATTTTNDDYSTTVVTSTPDRTNAPQPQPMQFSGYYRCDDYPNYIFEYDYPKEELFSCF